MTQPICLVRSAWEPNSKGQLIYIDTNFRSMGTGYIRKGDEPIVWVEQVLNGCGGWCNLVCVGLGFNECINNLDWSAFFGNSCVWARTIAEALTREAKHQTHSAWMG